MKKKGFTLIELLAVILILAIIAVIVTPIISKIIDEAKTQADKRSAEKFVRAAQVFYTESQVDEAKGNMLGTNVINQLDLENTDAEGAVVVNTDGSIEMAIVIGKKCYTKTATQDIKDIEVSKDIENCSVLSSSVAISTIESKTDSIVITVDPGDSGITIATCKFGRARGEYTEDGVIEGNTCTLTPCETGKKYYYEITFSDGSKRSGGMQAGTGEIARPNNGGGSSSGSVSGGGSGSGGSGSGGSGSGGGVAAPVLSGAYGETIYTGTYLSVVKPIFFDVTNGVQCDINAWSTNGGGGTGAMKTGCLRFYAYMEDNLSYTAILDRNTTNAYAWGSSWDAAGSGPTVGAARLKADTDSWKGTVTPKDYVYVLGATPYVINYTTDGYHARFITSNELAHITGNESFDPHSSGMNDWYYLDGGTSASTGASWQTQIATSTQKSAYYWLYNYIVRCTDYGCYNNGDTYGYWTSDAIAGTNSQAWMVGGKGAVGTRRTVGTYGNSDDNVGSGSEYGIRPVVTILKSALN